MVSGIDPSELRAARESAGLTQHELARLVGAAGGERVSRWELGVRFVRAHGLPHDLLQPVECQDPLRPRDVSLASDWRAPRSLSAMLADS